MVNIEKYIISTLLASVWIGSPWFFIAAIGIWANIIFDGWPPVTIKMIKRTRAAKAKAIVNILFNTIRRE